MSGEPDPAGGARPDATVAAQPDRLSDVAEDRRPLIERLGLGAIAIVIAGLFGTVAAVTLTNGEIFLGVMAATGALMTMWAALGTLRKG
jgi:hypothetical protein